MSKILVVEDDPNILESVKYNLQKDGYDTLTAVDGAQALEIARSGKPDLIILDILLPQNEWLGSMPYLTQRNGHTNNNANGQGYRN